MEGLQILGFRKDKVMAHPKVRYVLVRGFNGSCKLTDCGVTQVKEWSRTLVTTRNTSAVDDA